jgi:hypothetical protein
MAGRFVPDSWELTDKLRDYARKKNLTDETIDDQEEAFRLCQFNRNITDWDRAFMRWIRSAIEWGKVQPTQQPTYRKPYEITEEDRQRDLRAFEEQIARFKGNRK